tara:strand:+ start:427 stop:765 length:339 start_codon:yes stop_codon:yes gene_type:complete
MTCGLHGKLDTAVAAVKEALTTALDGDFAEKDLEDILAAYTNLKSVSKRVGHPGITFTPDTTLADSISFNDDIKIDTTSYGAAEPVTFGAGYDYLGGGQDVITFGDDIHNDV